MANVPNTTLLSKARSFMGKSAVIAIAPLAMVQVADAATTFGVPGGSSGGFGSGFISGGGMPSFSQTSFSASALPESNSITGARISVSGDFNSDTGMGDGQFTLLLGGAAITGTALGAGTAIPVSYNFTLSKDGASSLTSWVLDFGIGPDAATGASISGSGYGTHSGTVMLTTGASSLHYYPTLTLSVSNFGGSELLTVDMSGIGQGVSLNAVPEPSSAALFVGGSLFAFFRGRRRPVREIA